MSEDNSVVEGNDNSTMLDDNDEEEYIKIAGEADHESDVMKSYSTPRGGLKDVLR